MAKTDINFISYKDVVLENTTPVMRQYLNIKHENPDAILLYRLGDFYETFFEDAEIMSRVLEVTLTGKDAGSTYGRIPLAGVPVKAVEPYLERLIEKGHTVAICEQLEDPKFAKNLVKRGVVRTITAGTIAESEYLNQNANNYICAVFKDTKSELYGLAYSDISTGDFRVAEINYDILLSELARLQPSEIIAPTVAQKVLPFQIVPEQKIDLPKEITGKYFCSKVSSTLFDSTFSLNNLKAIFKTTSLSSYGYENCKLGFRAAGALVAYVWETMKDLCPQFETISVYELSEYVLLDSNSRKNLELTETLREKNKYGSLLWAIDRTKTNMGSRLIKSWICQPLKDYNKIINRQNVVEQLIENTTLRTRLNDILSKIYDIQRLSTKFSNNSACPLDFLSLKNTLLYLPDIAECTSQIDTDFFEKIYKHQDSLFELATLIDKTINENAPRIVKDGNVINPDVSAELDYYRSLLSGGEEWLEAYEQREKEKTGCKFLKVAHNNVFGYYIEISNSNLHLVPSNYVRKQTLTNAERFITDELKKHEDEVISAKFKAVELEISLFNNLKKYSQEFVTQIREVADCIAQLDVLLSFASIAVESNYTKPQLSMGNEFIVKNGRHAVLEKILPMGAYVPNDLDVEADTKEKTQFMILTGPNMAGKSTYMRQNALILILAQIGCWVPADYAQIGIVDKIFTRVGASDDLTLGQSTFMVEMVETANILNSATSKSFILLDEIGRGTSTYDGVAIAWSVAEFIAEKIKARCIFATHYHELNVMTRTYPHIKNYRITISEENGEIEFLRKIVQGGASKSYGIQVAKMAGLPTAVVKRSEALMTKLQKTFANDLSTPKRKDDLAVTTPQLNLFQEE